jgi:hypothetical protein
MNMAASYSQRLPANHAKVITETLQVHKEFPKDTSRRTKFLAARVDPPSFYGLEARSAKKSGRWPLDPPPQDTACLGVVEYPLQLGTWGTVLRLAIFPCRSDIGRGLGVFLFFLLLYFIFDVQVPVAKRPR